LGIIFLNEVTDEELLALRGEMMSISAIECDSPVTAIDDELISLDRCDDDDMKMPLLITFSRSCLYSCQIETMKGANIDKTKFDQTTLGMFMLNEVTDEQLLALRGEIMAISAIGCDDLIKEELDDSSLIPLDKCDDGDMKMPLLITFAETCDSTCQLETMKGANIDKTKFSQTTLGVTFLNEVTDEQLLALRGENRTISAIECDFTVTAIEDNPSLIILDNCDDDNMKMPLLITFDEACDISCSLGIMLRANIDESKYEETDLGIVFLNEVTDEQLVGLRGENGTISAIECDSTVTAPSSGSNTITALSSFWMMLIAITSLCLYP